MADDFSEIIQETTNQRTINASAITLLNGIAGRIEAAVAASDAGDNTALTNLAASIRQENQALADAVAANVPAV